MNEPTPNNNPNNEPFADAESIRWAMKLDEREHQRRVYDASEDNAEWRSLMTELSRFAA